MVSALATVWGLLSNRVPSASTRGIGQLAPHHSSVVGLQQFRRRTHIPHSRIEPQVVAVWIEDDWHRGVYTGQGGFCHVCPSCKTDITAGADVVSRTPAAARVLSDTQKAAMRAGRVARG